MSLIIQCPSCEKRLKLGEATAQKSVISCPACSQKIRISNDDQAANEQAAAPPEKSEPAKRGPNRNSSGTSRSSRTSDAASNRSAKRSSRSAALPPDDQYEDYEEYEEFAPRRSARPKPSVRRHQKQSTGNRAVGVALVAGSVAVGIFAFAGAIWWVVNTINDDVDNADTPNVAQSDPADQSPPVGGSVPNANGAGQVAPTNPEGSSGGVQSQSPNSQPPAFKPAAVASNRANAFRYALKPGDTHVYTFELDAEVDRQTVSFPGSVTMTVAKGRAGQPDEVVSGTGTGFVVSSSGFLITCHHVVEDATSVEVILNGKSHLGQVIAIDKDQDLALVEIEANNLPFVSLADSGRVRLAEDVRAIGFPLTDLLGQGLKVTRGTISGINDDPEGRRFQIDANINPGNSGGPLFNERGDVIGINSAKLVSGSSISSVGFSVPVNYAKRLLQQNSVSFQMNDDGPILGGPELVQKVKPAVALLKVESRRKINQQYVLNYNGSYTDPTASSGSSMRGPVGMRIPNMRFGPPTSSSRTYSRGKVVLDEYGAVDNFEDQEQLPFSTGSMAMLMIHELDPDGASSWTREDRFVLTKPKQRSNTPFGFPGPRFGPRFGGGPFGGPAQEEPDEILTGGIETHRYRILESNDREIKISRKYELRTLDDPVRPMTKITGQGTIVFDKTYGMPKSMSYRQVYESNSNGKAVKIPIAISYRMQDPSILKNKRAELAKAAADKKAEAAARAAKEAAMSDDERLDFYIAEIKASRGKSVYKQLAQIEVVESRREEICDLLAPCLASSRPDGNQIAALGHWATPKIVGVMITKLEAMDNSDWPAGRTLVTALGKTKDERAIKPIVKKLTSRSHPWHDPAAKALINFGSKVEGEVLAILKVKPTAETIKILGAIGTQESMSTLKELANHKDFWIKKAAKEAITEVALRL